MVNSRLIKLEEKAPPSGSESSDLSYESFIACCINAKGVAAELCFECGSLILCSEVYSFVVACKGMSS